MGSSLSVANAVAIALTSTLSMPPASAADGGTIEVTDVEAFLAKSLEDLLELKVVTATKTARSLQETPSIVTVFTRVDIDALGATSLIDLLRFVPGYYEVSSLQGRSFAVRGVHASSAQHFVVLVDGLPQGDFITGTSAPDFFRLDLAERVEIVRGPGSSLYGASALMGVVNIITRDVCDAIRLRSALGLTSNAGLRASLAGCEGGATAGSVIASASFWTSPGAEFLVSAEQDIVLPSIGKNISDGIRRGEELTAPRARSPVRAHAYGPSYEVALRYSLPQGLTLRANAARLHYRMQRTLRDSLTDIDAPEPPAYIRERLLVDVEASFGDEDRWGRVSFRPSVALLGHEVRSQLIAGALDLQMVAEQQPVATRWRGRDLRARLSVEHALRPSDIGALTRLSIISGVNINYDVALGYETSDCFPDADNRFPPPPQSHEGGINDIFCTRAVMLDEGLTVDAQGRYVDSDTAHLGDGDELRLGLFAEASWSLGPASVVTGARFDYDPHFGPVLSPRAALVSDLPARFHAKMQVASAFFYPAFMHRTSNRGFMYVGNPAVHPQSIDTYEMLLGWASPAIRGEVNAYVNRVRDFITFDRVRRAQSGKLQFSNQGDLSVAGLELQAVFLPATWLRLNANGAVTHPIDSQTDPMFLVQGGLGGASVFPRLLTTLRAAVDLWEGVWLSLGACYSSRVDFEIVPEVRFTGLVGTDGGIYDSRPAESYDTGELSFDIALSIELPAGFRMVASASNVTNDKSYMPGATLLPYLRQGRVVEIVIMHELSTDAGE